MTKNIDSFAGTAMSDGTLVSSSSSYVIGMEVEPKQQGPRVLKVACQYSTRRMSILLDVTEYINANDKKAAEFLTFVRQKAFSAIKDYPRYFGSSKFYEKEMLLYYTDENHEQVIVNSASAVKVIVDGDDVYTLIACAPVCGRGYVFLCDGGVGCKQAGCPPNQIQCGQRLYRDQVKRRRTTVPAKKFDVVTRQTVK
ncbi:hypothetical protein MPSEU_000122400 [Mayamaea pseudoterrestris]|nr:hypothetical protein MPSEU_000122400 [Mayamaea pseudoterrestris]